MAYPGQGHVYQQQPLRAQFQSIDDFMREQEQLDAVKSAEMKARAQAALANSNIKKVKKAPIDVEAAAAEARAVAEMGDTNWTGRLLEYRNAHPVKVKGLIYNESPVHGNKFRCSVKIFETPLEFGDKTVSFTKKKDAKQHASKKAIDWLIEHKFMPSDGTVKFPKPVLPPNAKVIGPQISPPHSKGLKTSFAAQIPDLCIKLGFAMPKYEIERTSDITALYSGYAHFHGDPRIVDDRIGEVKDVFGQKNAKEQIAEELLSFLKDIERQRGETNDEEEEDRKRKRSLDDSSDVREKSAKLDA